MMKILSTLTLFLLPFLLSAQDSFDCITAREVCSGETINAELFLSMGNDVEVFDDLCGNILNVINLEEDVLWFKYRFTTFGTFEFTITPEVFAADMDFAVFKTSSGDCSNLETIRCCFSGQNIVPGPNVDSVCLGPTGLVEGSLDFEELGGCNPGDDNFLAPVYTTPGDVLYLMVYSFNGSLDFTIEHTGTTTISCDPVNSQESYLSPVHFYPNPANDFIIIDDQGGGSRNLSFDLLDLNGRMVKKELHFINSKIDVSDLAKGIYFLKVRNNHNFIAMKKLIKM
ncbi:MAG: T9SS type A sorting domain-containing protein [Bacteroidota bacterium]